MQQEKSDISKNGSEQRNAGDHSVFYLVSESEKLPVKMVGLVPLKRWSPSIPDTSKAMVEMKLP